MKQKKIEEKKGKEEGYGKGRGVSNVDLLLDINSRTFFDYLVMCDQKKPKKSEFDSHQRKRFVD